MAEGEAAAAAAAAVCERYWLMLNGDGDDACCKAACCIARSDSAGSPSSLSVGPVAWSVWGTWMTGVAVLLDELRAPNDRYGSPLVPLAPLASPVTENGESLAVETPPMLAPSTALAAGCPATA